MEELTLGDIKGLLEFMVQVAGGLTVTDFAAFFDEIEALLRQYNQWTAEIEAGLAEAEAQLTANPGLFGEGIEEFQATVTGLLTKYPLDTPISQIPELSGIGGGDGLPTIEPGPGGISIADLSAAIFADVTVDFDAATGIVTVEGAGYSFALPNIARITFEDGTLAFDFSGIAGQAYRIYQAAFDRTPDGGGLSYWIGEMDGGKSLFQTAADFVYSPEFQAIYGVDPTALELISQFYENVLGRAGEQSGIDYWVNEIESGAKSIVQVLMDFSESPENVQGVAPAISDGIFYA